MRRVERLLLPDNFRLLAVRFSIRYSAEQILPSCIWGTHAPHLVATASGLDAAVVLKAPHAQATVSGTLSPDDAAVLLQALGLQSVRSLLATTILLSQILRSVSLGTRASEAFKAYD